MDATKIAQIAYEANRIYTGAGVLWSEAPEWIKKDAADRVRAYMASLGVTPGIIHPKSPDDQLFADVVYGLRNFYEPIQ
jgi:hypothetical protein